MLHLHDTATGQVRPLNLRQDGQVSMYVCGPTVDNVPHIGHGRFNLVFDVIRRYLLFTGLDVVYVSNVTDIDDKIINRAAAEGRSTESVVEQYEKAWFDAMGALGVMAPTHIPHATEWIAEMIDLVSTLIERDLAYIAADGVYLEVGKIPSYGLLARQSLESLRPGARIDAVADKRSPYDFALWKFAKPGEPTWPAPFGDGRPGWHTECVVMSLGLLGDGFDLHGGGSDLMFPHHENERAQAVALGHEFAQLWVHNAMVEVGGQKMSKSLGNFTTLEDLLERHDSRAYRLLVLRSRYRSPIEVADHTLADATEGLRRLDRLAERMGLDPALSEVSEMDAVAQGVDPGALAAFKAALENDLDTPAALAQIFDLVTVANTALDEGRTEQARQAAVTVAVLAGALGLGLRSEGAAIDERTQSLIAARDAARAARDFGRADQIRDDLVALGWTVEDTPTGTKVSR